MMANMRCMFVVVFFSLCVSCFETQYETQRVKRETLTPEVDFSDSIQSMKIRVARVGVELTRVGTGLSFQKVWHQVIAIKLPSFEEYESLLKKMQMNCLVYTKEQYRMYDNPRRPDKNTTVADLYFFTLQKRCIEFQAQIKRKTFAMIRNAFSSSLPQPDTFEPLDLPPLRRVEYLTTPPAPLYFNVFNDNADDPSSNETGKGYEVDHESKNEDSLEEVGQNSSSSLSHEREDDSNQITTTSFPLSYEAALNSTIELNSTDFLLDLGANVSLTTKPVPLSMRKGMQRSNITPDTRITNSSQVNVSLSRAKKAVPVLGALAAVLVASLFTTGIGVGMGMSRQRNVDAEKFQDLEAKLERLLEMNLQNEEESVGLREDLIGFTNYTYSVTKERMRRNSQFHSVFEKEMNIQATLLNHLSRGDLVSNQIFFSLASEADFMRRLNAIMDDLKMKISTYELGISQMQAGYLPSTIVSYKRMRALLDMISRSLPAEYSLYFEKENVGRYYSIPLVNFLVRQGIVYLRLAIPLTVTTSERHVSEVSLYRPVFLPFPRPLNWKVEENVEFVRFKEISNQIWAFHNNHFFALSNKKYFNCLPRGDQSLCVSFYEKPYERPDLCLSSLIGKDRDTIGRNCHFTFANKDDYMPVELDTGRYYIHTADNVTFYEDCLGNQKKLELEAKHDGFSIDIPPGCLLRVLNVIRAGGLRQIRRIDMSLGNPFVPNRVDFNVSLRVKPESLSVNQLNRSLLVDTMRTDGDQVIHAMISRMRRDSEQIRIRMEETRNMTKESHYYSAWDAILSLEDIIFDTVVIFLLFKFARHTQYVAFFSPTVLVISKVEGFDLGLHDIIQAQSIFEWNLSSIILHYLSLFKIILFILAVFLILFRNYFYRIHVSTFYGEVKTILRPRFWVEIALTVVDESWKTSYNKIMIIRVPVNGKKEVLENTMSCLVMNETCFFITRKRYNHLILSEEIELRGITNDGYYYWESFAFPTVEWKDIHWQNEFKPNNFFDGRYGSCRVRIIPDPSKLSPRLDPLV